MNLYADAGNLHCLQYRINKMGYQTKMLSCGIGDKIPEFDIMLVGGGQDKEIDIIQKDIVRKAPSLKYYIENEKTILAICGGYQLLGEYFQKENTIIKLSGILPFYTVACGDRAVGNIVYKTDFGKVVGFENHSGKTYLQNGLKPLGKVVCGVGNNDEDKGEGIIYNNVFCTYAHGPVLPKNPNFADELIRRALRLSVLPKLDDDLEKKCQNQLVNRFS